MATENNNKKLLIRLSVIFALMLGVVLLYRWNRIFYALSMEEIADEFSDFPEHIRFALTGADYSAVSYILRFLFSLGNEKFARVLLSLILTANQLFTIVTTTILLKALFPKLEACLLFLASELSLVCAPWIIPGYQSTLYINACNGNLYHNMTFLFSRGFIPLAFLFFLKCWAKRHDKPELKDLILFSLCFLFATMFKANFAFAFIPMLAIMLLYDLIKYRGKNLKNEILIGMTVLPAGINCIVQYTVLFAPDFAGNEPSQVALRLVLGAELVGLVVMYLRSFLLPIYTFSLRGKKEDSFGDIALILICEAVAIIEAVVFTETGFRATDGNFDWGSLVMQSSVFAIGISMLIPMLADCIREKGKNHAKLAKAVLGIVILLGHLATGVFFIRYFAAANGFWI